jgi:hypothetical protein
VAQAGRSIELLEFGGGVTGGNRIRFNHRRILSEPHGAVNYGRSANVRQDHREVTVFCVTDIN